MRWPHHGRLPIVELARKVFLAAASWLAIAIASPIALAVSPIIGSHAHPYDPDWPTVRWILDNKCISCHRSGQEISDYSTYESLMRSVEAGDQDSPVVVPGDAKGSPLWDYSAWNATADPQSKLPASPMMPQGKELRHDWLTAGQIDTLFRWIQNGARKFRDDNYCGPVPVTEIDFPSAKQCGVCHPKQYREWSRSMHAYGQHSPVFEAFHLTLVERSAGTIGTFCTRCHTPIGTSLGENESLRNVHRTRISMEGVTCIVCHRRKEARYKSSSRISFEPGPVDTVCQFGPFEDSVSAQVGTHPSAGLPYIKSSQFCGECHDVTSPQGVRLEEAYSEWAHSPAAKHGITCQMCHMGPVQGVPIPEDQRPLGRAAEVPGVDPSRLPLRRLTDHSFPGPDYSLLPDTEFPNKLDWMYETDYRDPSRLTPYQQRTLTELRRQNRRELEIYDRKRYELLGNAASIEVRHPQCAAPGEKLTVEVDVCNKTGGHNFPTGFTAERQLWISVDVRDSLGRQVFASGDVDHNGDLRDDHSHAVLAGHAPFDWHLANFQNKFTALTNKGTERTVVLSVNRNLTPVNVLRPATGISASFGRPAAFRIAKGSLPPLTTRTVGYPIDLPPQPGVYHVQVRLNFRHLPPTLLDHIGTPHLKHQLETVVIDQHQGTIVVQ